MSCPSCEHQDYQRELDRLSDDFQKLESIFHTMREILEEKIADLTEEVRKNGQSADTK